MSESAQIRSRLNAYTAVPEHSSKPVKPSTLNALTDKGRERYLTRTVSESAAKERDEFKQTFAKMQDARRRQSEPARRSTLGVARLGCNIGLESKSQVHE